MKKIIYLFILFVSVASCFEDKTEFGNNILSEISVDEGIADNYTKEKMEELSIVPQISQTDNSFDLKYEWYVDFNLVSTEKDLNYTCKELGDYKCYLKVTNKYGSTYRDFNLKVNSPYEQGLLVLSENNGKTMLSFKRRDKENSSFVKDVFKLNNPVFNLGAKPLALQYVNKNIFVSTSNPSQLITMDEKTFEIAKEIKNEEEEMHAAVVNREPGLVVATIIGNGEVFSYMPGNDQFMTFLREGLPDNYYIEDKSVYVSNDGGNDGSGQVFFEKHTNKLMWFCPSFKYEKLENSSFPDCELVDMLACEKYKNVMLIFKRNSGELAITRYSVFEDLVLSDVNAHNTTIIENSQRLVHPKNPLLYYTKDSKIYRYNYLSDNIPAEGGNFITVEADNITKMLFTPEGDKLFVAYNIGSGDLTGCVNCYDANSGELIWEEKNIAGNIVDLLYR